MNFSTAYYDLDPVPTVFDTDRGVTPEQALAYRDLLPDGLHAVLCTWRKAPIWDDWQHQRPGFDDIVHHDGPIGHIPGKLTPGLVVFDVDDGTWADVDRFCRLYPPLLKAESRQRGRYHLYYLAGGPVNDGIFVGDGVSGDVRGAGGYIICWHNTIVELREALRSPGITSARAPLHLMVDRQAKRSSTLNANKELPQSSRLSGVSAVPPDTASPNPLIFDRVRFWAYQASSGTDRMAWRERVREQTRRQNAGMGNPLPSREVERMGASIADWVWERRVRGTTLAGPRGGDSVARRQGIASGKTRRRGTPLEHDRTPWIPLGVSRSTYYRHYRHLENGQASTRPKRPWLALGISSSAFRQRVSRARAGTYRGAREGVSPWKYVGISEEAWRTQYVNSETATTSGENHDTVLACHAFDTEPGIGCSGFGGWSVPTLTNQGLCDPIESAVALMEMVAHQNESGPSFTKRSPASQFHSGGVGILEAQKNISSYISKRRSALRSSLAQEWMGFAVEAYLDRLDVPYRAELVRRGLPVHSLRRPRRPDPNSDPMNMERRRRLAIQIGRGSSHDRKIAEAIYEREQRLGAAPATSPWERAKREAKLEAISKGWHMSPEERQQRRLAARARWEFIIATDYRPTLTVGEAASQAYGLAA